jgi:hypothetical protein
MSEKQTGIIANPIYDAAFKKLMATDNDADRENARYFVGTVLGEEITEIDYLPQEYSYHSKQKGKAKQAKQAKPQSEAEKLRLMRLDFVATIRTQNGENKRVMVEIQRSNNPADLWRFRGYIGEQYLQTDKIKEGEIDDKPPMPIVVIFVLGFELPGINTIVMKVGRTYIDLLNPATKFDKNPYIESLSHDCYFIQVPRINAKTYTDFDKCPELLQMLSVFEQDYFKEDEEEKIRKKYPYTITNKKLKKMVETLEYIATDPETRRLMKEEYWAAFNERVWKKQVETLSSKNAALSDEIADLRRQLQQFQMANLN